MNHISDNKILFNLWYHLRCIHPLVKSIKSKKKLWFLSKLEVLGQNKLRDYFISVYFVIKKKGKWRLKMYLSTMSISQIDMFIKLKS